jgi:predicted DNA binding CopG/RHH family protein
MSTKKNKIQYGEKDRLSAEDFAPENVKQRISIMIDMDVLDKVKVHAKNAGLPYQTFINQLLRQHVSGQSTVEQRLKKIEETIFKKAK